MSSVHRRRSGLISKISEPKMEVSVLRKLSFLFALLCITRPALADDPKFDHRIEDDTTPAPKPTVWKANAQLGFLLVQGNSESIGLSGSALGSVKHYNNAFELFVQGAYSFVGTQSVKDGPIDGHKTAVQNWLGRARYDRFLSKMNSVFASFVVSGDQPSGYVYRLEPQIGYSRIFFQSVHQTFKGDFGYDYTYDHYVAGTPPPRNLDFHSARVFLGYESKFSPYAIFSEGVEVLWALNDPDNLDHVRINSLTSLSSTVTKRVSLKLNLTLKANLHPPTRPNDPVTMMPMGEYEKLDTTLEAVLAVTFL